MNTLNLRRTVCNAIETHFPDKQTQKTTGSRTLGRSIFNAFKGMDGNLKGVDLINEKNKLSFVLHVKPEFFNKDAIYEWGNIENHTLEINIRNDGNNVEFMKKKNSNNGPIVEIAMKTNNNEEEYIVSFNSDHTEDFETKERTLSLNMELTLELIFEGDATTEKTQ